MTFCGLEFETATAAVYTLLLAVTGVLLLGLSGAALWRVLT